MEKYDKLLREYRELKKNFDELQERYNRVKDRLQIPVRTFNIYTDNNEDVAVILKRYVR